MKRHVWVASMSLLTLVGCYSRTVDKAYLDPGYPNERVATIAVLPLINKTSATMAHERILESLTRQLSRDKHYTVVPTAKVMAALRQGGGAAAFSQLMNRVSDGADIPDAVLSGLAKSLDADAVFLETILSYHQLMEDGMGATMQGSIAYQQFPVSVVSVGGALWGAHSGTQLWRDEVLERYYHNTAAGTDIAPAVDAATRSLLAHFPENTWAPAAPGAPSPVPSPVTSLVPFPTPADPGTR